MMMAGKTTLFCLGTGEAFDSSEGNTSFLLRNIGASDLLANEVSSNEVSSNEVVANQSMATSLIFDCGFAAASEVFKQILDPNEVDAIYVSHFHADHTFGIPPILTRWWLDGRTKPLTIIGQAGTKSRIEAIFELGYAGVFRKLPYQLDFIEGTEPVKFGSLSFSFAQTVHTERNFAALISTAAGPLFISGDGAPSMESLALAAQARWVFHEAFSLAANTPNHATVHELIEKLGREKTKPKLYFTHISHKERPLVIESLPELESSYGGSVFVPRRGEEIELR